MKRKPKAKREGSLRIPVSFDRAMARAVTVRPPEEGWKAHMESLKRVKARK